MGRYSVAVVPRRCTAVVKLLMGDGLTRSPFLVEKVKMPKIVKLREYINDDFEQ
jgi:hypothetical protein